jgi:hypothetical protein
MSIFGNIMASIFGHSAKAQETQSSKSPAVAPTTVARPRPPWKSMWRLCWTSLHLKESKN